MLVVLVMLLMVAVGAVSAQDDLKKFPSCQVCGMDRAKFAHSRMVIEYEDGTTVGVCSIHCAAADMKQNKDKQVRSLTVADYGTKELIDARTATWVVGGKKAGVMTSTPKWAFAREEEARKFIQENGGQVTPFDGVMKAANEEMGDKKRMACHDKPGAQMLFNPAFGDPAYHTHPAGMWMINYAFMHMDMRGLRHGTTNVPAANVGFMRGTPYNYMMIPTSMTMDMHMGMVMYGITDRITGMVMGNYQVYEMKMLMDMGPMMGVSEDSPMRTSGIGDTELRGLYKINEYLVGSLGLSLPTGSIEEKFVTMGETFRAPYDMQLGSGTYDLKPTLTYNDVSKDGKWNWGGQAQYTWHTAKNKNDWALGDNFKLTGWLQRALGPFTTWARFAFNYTGRIRGEDPTIAIINHPRKGLGASMPDADPDNYGGRRLDGFVGVSYMLGPFSLGVEGGMPLYQYLNGLQMKTDWMINVGAQIMF